MMIVREVKSVSVTQFVDGRTSRLDDNPYVLEVTIRDQHKDCPNSFVIRWPKGTYPAIQEKHFEKHHAKV